MNVVFETLPSPAVLVAAVAARVQRALSPGLEAGGRASLALSGGSTPRLYLPTVAGLPLDWSRVTVTLTDEHCVSTDHPWSNTRMLRDVLLHGAAAAARMVALIPDGVDAAADPEAAAARADAAIASVPHPFDLVLLGMGEDGHVAALLPGSHALAAALDPAQTARCLAVEVPHTALPQEPRLTMPLAELLRSRARVLVFQGHAKRALFEQACASGDATRYPIAALAAADGPPLDVLWCP